MELFPREFGLELNTKNMSNSPSFLIITHTTLSAKQFRSYGISPIDVAAEILFLDRTAVERTFTFPSRIGRNSGSPEYHFRRQFSQLSDGPSNGSGRLAICELWQSKTRPIARTAFLTDHTFLYKIGFWWNFAMTSPETSYTKKHRQWTKLSVGYSYDSFRRTGWLLRCFEILIQFRTG
jgi:hypothetical protein